MSLDPRSTGSFEDIRSRGIIPLEGKVCAFVGCGRVPSAVEPKQHRAKQHRDKVGVHWYSKQHEREGPKGAVFPIGRVCGAPGDRHEAPCGAATTHLLLADIEGVGLRVVPLCDRHATRMIDAAKPT